MQKQKLSEEWKISRKFQIWLVKYKHFTKVYDTLVYNNEHRRVQKGVLAMSIYLRSETRQVSSLSPWVPQRVLEFRNSNPKGKIGSFRPYSRQLASNLLQR